MTHTLQSNRCKKRQRERVMPPAWHRAVAAHRLADEVRRIALPTRMPDPQAGAEHQRWLIEGKGWAINVQLLEPADIKCRRPRSDQYRVTINGELWRERAGLVALMDHLRTAEIPRAMTRLQRYRADQDGEFMAHCFDAIIEL